jgi:hypothetical protein
MRNRIAAIFFGIFVALAVPLIAEESEFAKAQKYDKEIRKQEREHIKELQKQEREYYKHMREMERERNKHLREREREYHKLMRERDREYQKRMKEYYKHQAPYPSQYHHVPYPPHQPAPPIISGPQVHGRIGGAIEVIW